VTRRALLIGWVVVALLFFAILGYELAQWRALSDDAARAAAERQRLQEEVRLRDAQITSALRGQAARLAQMQWAPVGGDPSSFLTRLAELAGDKRVKVTAVGPLERQSTPQWVKSWHTVQVVAPYREVRELAARIEAERGLLEDVRLEPAPPPAGRGDASAPSDEVQARFRMTALELAPASRRLVDRALGQPAASPPSAPPVTPAPVARDPFAFVVSAKPAAPAAATRPERPLVPLDLSAIVGFPGGSLAIVNNQVVKVGDVVSGHRVDAITETTVTLTEPGAARRTLQLPELGAAPAPSPRR
jgi:hypothetical protein